MSSLLAGLLLLAAPARAEALRWSLQVAPGEVGVVEVLQPTADGGEHRLLRLLTEDGGQRSRMGWRPDEQPAPGRVEGGIELALPAGFYVVQERDSQGLRRRALGLREQPPTAAGRLPAGATGVLAWGQRDGDGGDDAVAWAPAVSGRAGLALSTGRWRLVPTGVGGFSPEDLVVQAGRAQALPTFRPRRAPAARALPDRRQVLRFVLLPLTGLLLAAGAWGLRLARPRRGLLLALAVAALAVVLAMPEVLLDPTGRILDAGPPIEDPAGSTGLLATMTAGLAGLTDRAPIFAFPEGASWLSIGPTWLGFLPATVVAALAGPVAGHDLGVALGLFLLALCSQALARDLGARPWAAALAGLATALGPGVIDELDAWTLDRSTLWLVPLALLALHRAVRLRGWRWPLLAGAALAATFYGQVYYGLYLVVVAPLLALYRLPGPGWRARTGRLLLAGVVALALLLPGLGLLRAGTSASPYSAQDQAEQTWEEAEVATFLEQHDPSLGARSTDRKLPMATPQQRRLTATALGLTLDEALRPADLLPGRALYWPLALLSLALCRRERRLACAVALADVALLMLHAMGPHLRASPTTLGPPLPFALEMALVPGFEQLKNSHRFGLLAASLASVPLALGLDGLLQRLPRRPARWLAPPLALGLAALLVGLRLPRLEPRLGPSAQGARPTVDWELRRPHSSLLPTAPALDRVEPAPAFALPLAHPVQAEVVLSATARGFALANPPPFDSGEGSELSQGLELPLLVEEDPLLNRLAWTAGSDRAGVWLELDEATAASARERLRGWGLRYVLLYRQLLPPQLLDETEAALDRWLERVDTDGDVAVWAL